MQALLDLERQITARLHTEEFGRPLHAYDRVPSTNDVATKLAEQGATEGTTVLAREQTAGRGRFGRSWASPPGGLYVSIVLRPEMPADQWPLLSLGSAVGAAKAAESITGSRITLKWPNDLISGTKKVGGVLIEAQTAFAVAGIGINAAAPPEPLHPEATSLNVELIPLVCEVLRQVEASIRTIYDDPLEVLAEWRSRSATLGQHVHVMGREELSGVAEDIDEDGALLLRTPQGVRRVFAGDVSVR